MRAVTSTSRFHPIHQLDKAGSLFGGHRTADAFCDQSTRLNGESGGEDFQPLIFSGLIGRGNATVSKNTRHDADSVRKSSTNYSVHPKSVLLTFVHLRKDLYETVRFRTSLASGKWLSRFRAREAITITGKIAGDNLSENLAPVSPHTYRMTVWSTPWVWRFPKIRYWNGDKFGYKNSTQSHAGRGFREISMGLFCRLFKRTLYCWIPASSHA